jgi:acetyl-CoA synthetase
MWYHTVVGNERCPIVDTWWQTETGGHLITPLPGATPTKPGSCTLPLPGIITDIVDETGHSVGKGKGGILVIKRPWPSMIRTIWGDPERFKKSYYPDDFHGRYYLAGDGASTDQDGYYRIMGRIDDVLNVSGHRLGTMEIESARVANTNLVAEAAVVGRPDDLTGEAVCAFVVLKGARPTGDEALKIAKELRDWVGKEIGPIAKPKDIRFGDNLPKTRSGKIMRRLLRSIAKGEEITQDVSTLENPAILEQLRGDDPAAPRPAAAKARRKAGAAPRKPSARRKSRPVSAAAAKRAAPRKKSRAPARKSARRVARAAPARGPAAGRRRAAARRRR